MPTKFAAQILLVDDDDGNRQALSLLLRNFGYRVATANSGEAALELLAKSTYGVVLTDLFLPGVSGIDILKSIKENSPATNVILITGHASAETAVEAMKEGAFDYITKPVDFEKLKILVAKAVEKSRLVAENLYLRQQLRGKYKFDNQMVYFGDETTSRVHPDNLGVIGLPLFMKFNIIFDYINNRLYIDSNSRYDGSIEGDKN